MQPDGRGAERFRLRRSSLSRRRFLQLAGGGVALGTIAACTNTGVTQQTGSPAGSPAGSPGIEPVKGGGIIEAINANFSGLNPLFHSQANDGIPWTMLFDGLLTVDANGELIPLLATEMPKVESDNLTYRVSLRQDVKWTDGRPLTSADVAFTYSLMFDPKYAAVRSPFRGDLQKYLASVQTPDAHTVIFKLKTPYSPFLASHGLRGILPKHVLENLSPEAINDTEFNRAPNVTSGVFKFVRWVQGDHLALARNDAYYRGAAYLDEYIIQTVPTSQNVLSGLQSGQLDVSRITDPAQVETLRRTPGLEVLQYPTGITLIWAYQLDPSKPASRIFGDKLVRQALLYSIDRQGILDGPYSKIGGEVAKSFVPLYSWAYDPNVTPTYTYDKAKAAELLDQAGWRRGPGGIRQKDGVPMKFSVLTTNQSTQYTAITQIMQQNWGELGAEVSSNFVLSVPMQVAQVQTHDFDLGIFPQSYLSTDPDLSPWFHSRNAPPGGFNSSGYRNPKVDELLDQAAAEPDRAKRKPLYKQVMDILAEDVPIVPVINQNGWFAVNTRKVHNMQMGSMNNQGPRPWLNKVFVTQ